MMSQLKWILELLGEYRQFHQGLLGHQTLRKL